MPLLKRPVAVVGRLSLVVALVAVGLAPLLVGAVHPPVLVGVSGLATLALGLHIGERIWSKRRLCVSWLVLPFLVGIGSMLFHLVPLPEFLRSLLAPEATDTLEWVRSALPAQYQAAVRSVLSLDAAATAQSALRLIASLFVFVVVADRCRERTTRRLAYRIVGGFAAALFVVSLGHKVVAAEKIYGLFPPTGYTPLYGPLINPNHLARAFGVFGLLCIGRGVQVRSRTEAAAYLLTGTLLCVGVLATVSRGGIGALLVASLLGFALFLYARRGKNEPSQLDENPSRTNAALIGALVFAATLLLAGFFAWDSLAFEAGRELNIEGTKLKLIPVGLRLLDEHWRVGVGSGAFFQGVPGVLRTADLNQELTVVFAENILVETLTTHGVFVGAVLFVLALVGAVSLVNRLPPEAAFPIAALTFLFVGELFDFTFEVGFGALLVALCLGLAVGPTLDDNGRKLNASKVGIAAGMLTVVGIWLSVVAIVDDNRRAEKHAQAASKEARQDAFAAGLARHPFNSWFAYGLAVEARQRRDAGEALQWSNRALQLRPTMGAAHLEAARVLWAFGKREQAMTEYQLAWVNKQRIVPSEIVKRTEDLDLWRRAVPVPYPHLLAQLCETLFRAPKAGETQSALQEKAQTCLDEAALAPHATDRTRTRAVYLALKRGDLMGARERLQSIKERLPVEEVSFIDVRITALADGRVAAREKANAYANNLTDPTLVLRWLLDDAQRQKNHSVVHGLLAQLRHHTRDAKLREVYDLIEVDTLLAEGETTRALRGLTTLVRSRPRRAPLLARLAKVQAALELTKEAQRSAKEALRYDPRNREAKKVLEGLSAP